MKFPKPFFRKSKQAWYLQLGKRQISLGKDRDEAFDRYKQLMLHEQGELPTETRKLNVAELCDLFLEWSQKNNAARTYEWYRDFLQDFCNHHGEKDSAKLIPFHVFVLAMQETGCRPSEVSQLTAENVDLEEGLWIFEEQKTRSKKALIASSTSPL